MELIAGHFFLLSCFISLLIASLYEYCLVVFYQSKLYSSVSQLNFVIKAHCIADMNVKKLFITYIEL